MSNKKMKKDCLVNFHVVVDCYDATLSLNANDSAAKTCEVLCYVMKSAIRKLSCQEDIIPNLK